MRRAPRTNQPAIVNQRHVHSAEPGRFSTCIVAVIFYGPQARLWIMLNHRSFPVGKSLVAALILLGALHADRPAIENPAIEPTTQITPSTAPEDPEPPPDPVVPEEEPATVEVDAADDPAMPSDVEPDTAPAADDPDRAEEGTEEMPTEAGEEPAEEDGLVQPAADGTVQIEPAVSVEPGPTATSSPLLRHDDLEAVTTRLAAIEANLAGQQQRALELVGSSNRTALIVAGVVAGVGVLAILIAAMILARILNRFSEVVMALPAAQPIQRASAIPWSTVTDLQPMSPTAVEQISARFLGAIEQLEQRIRELERPLQAGPPREDPGSIQRRSITIQNDPAISSPSATGASSSILNPAILASNEPVESAAAMSKRVNERHRRVEELLIHGESLLQNDSLEEALEQFDGALALEPQNADALIRRGMALERLQRMEAALESYDRAIASNGTLTLAYLHKGAVCNRLQRYREALECYERALETEHKG